MSRRYLEPGPLRAAAGALFAVVLALMFAVSDPVQAAGVLFVIPVALLALADGRRGGAAGAVVATVLLAVWVLADDPGLTVLGWVSRVTSFATIGLLVGHYEDLARGYERGRLDERYGAELHDRVVQNLVVAHYHLDGNPVARAAVSDALTGAKHIISSRLGAVAPGELRVSASDDPPAGDGR